MTTEFLSDTLIAVYDSSLTRDGWFKVLRRIADFSGSAGCRIIVEQKAGEPMILSVEDGVEHRSIGAPFEIAGIAGPADQHTPLPVGQLLVRSRMNIESFPAVCAEPWRSDDLGDVAAVLLLSSSNGSIVFEAMKTRQLGAYSDAELERVRLIASHLSRAIRISDSLNVSRLKSDLLETSLDALTAGIYFIGQQGRVVYLNRQARRQVSTGRVLRLLDDHLVATDRRSQKLLQAEFDRLDDRAELNDSSGCSIALADHAGSGYVAHVLPLQGARQSRFTEHFAAIAAVFVQDPTTVHSSVNGAFAKLYGLTDGELRLLNGLVPGLSIAEAARTLGISEATARTHLHRIFAKTKTSKQAELLYLLMTSKPPTISA